MELNLVISFDDTGSMSSVRREVRRKIATLVEELFNIYENLKIGIIIHNDYCDRDTIQKMDLTNQQADIIDFVNRDSSCGGGDYAECYALAIHEFRNFSWDSTNRVAILLGDAPPHEKGYKYGSKEELYDWREETTLAKAEGIRIYPIQALGHRGSTFFYQSVAALSGTIKLDLSQFAHVTQYITAITYQAADRLDEYENSQEAFKTNLMFKNMFAQLRGETPEELAADAYVAPTSSASTRTTPPRVAAPVGPARFDGSTPLTPAEMGARFQVLDVLKPCVIKTFVEEAGLHFSRGRGFYQLIMTELIQANKEVIFVDKLTGEVMMDTNKCRTMMGLPYGTKGKVNPKTIACAKQYDIFVQSNSANRALDTGTKFMYELESK
jgi:hypothetical protein